MQVDCQRLFDNHGVLIQVVGVLTYSNTPPRKFVQTFLLRRQQACHRHLCILAQSIQETNKAVQFSLFNDIFRFLKDESAAPAPAEPAAAAQGMPCRALRSPSRGASGGAGGDSRCRTSTRRRGRARTRTRARA